MNSTTSRPSPRRTNQHAEGFALVVTVSMMVLLAMLALGLLTLSSISLRASGQGADMATARANARLALTLAIGELQSTLGPDRAISATSGIRSENSAKPNLTGVWDSWNFDPESSPDYDGMKTSSFKRWLVSSASPGDLESPDFVGQGWDGETVELVGKGALGSNAPDSALARAGLVPLAEGGKPTGAYAWHVSDESVKARINLYRDPVDDGLLWRQRALLAGQRPDTSRIQDFNGQKLDFLPTDYTEQDYADAEQTGGKLLDLAQLSLLESNTSAKAFRNDITPYSLGVLANVREGGLKRDLSSVFALGTSLPGEFAGENAKLYQSTHGISGPSDPKWSTLSGYYNSFNSITDRDTNPTYYQAPTEHISITSLDPPTSYNPGPVIAKVEMLYTYVTRDSHWWGPLMGHLVYTPLITIHNPYNVNLSFDRLKVSIGSVPVGVKFFVNRAPQNLQLVPFNDMFVEGGPRNKETKFILEIANWSSPAATAPRGQIKMKPGQTMVCGPYLDPRANLEQQIGKRGPYPGQFTNWGNNLSGVKLPARPGFYGRCVGFDLDWVTPTHAPYDTVPTKQQDGQGVLLLKPTDMLNIEVGLVRQNTGLKNEFRVEAELTSNGSTRRYGGLRFQFGNQDNLEKFVDGKVYRYPAKGSLRAIDAYVPNTEALAEHASAKTFAVFSAYARTTNGGVYETLKRTETAGASNVLRDGRLAGKPFLHHNQARPVVNFNIATEKPGSQSHELNLQPFVSNGEAENYFSSDSENRTPALTGNMTTSGIKSGSYLELPTGPLQTIADFRRSNALTSSYLPGFVQPVGNSEVSPLMSTNKVVESNDKVAAYPLLDHSLLANHALYDRFYFSTFADYDSTKIDRVFSEFLEGNLNLISQAYQPNLPAGQTPESAKQELFSGGKPAELAYTKAAEFQMIQGPFNVNSTSLQAWKAMLSSLSGSDITTLWAKNNTLELKQSGGIPILGMSLPNGGVVGTDGDFDKIDNQRTNEWNGYRELDETEIEKLAVEIVNQVRERGPFLSMSEFVNRRVGSNSELTRSGALQTAIDKSGINESVFADQVQITEADISDDNLYSYTTPEVVAGNPAAGAPGWITQGDLMRILEPAATVRSDTFVIRVCGEARDSSGNLTARAYAEAVVQRTPEYVDSTNRPSLNVLTDSEGTKANQSFGRRMNVVSFRWLSLSEI